MSPSPRPRHRPPVAGGRAVSRGTPAGGAGRRRGDASGKPAGAQRDPAPVPGEVPRETESAPAVPEPRPAAAEPIFGERLALAQRFAGHLCTTGVEWGLIGPREVPRIWTRHILNCAVVGELMPANASVIDVGSGAGLPGLALLIARPDLRMTLLEPFERRTEWLALVARDLGLDVRIVRARAEDIAGGEKAAVVTARAVAPLERLARWGLPLVEPGGELLAIKGRTAQQEVDTSREQMRRLGARDVAVVQCGAGLLATPTTVVRARSRDRSSAARQGRRGGRA